MKSIIFRGAMHHCRAQHFSYCLGFNVGSLPFDCLNVHFFKIKPKSIDFHSLVDKMLAKLYSLKVVMLPISGMTQLVRSSIQGMAIHSISIYSWSVSVINSLEKDISSFIWSGDLITRNIVTMVWHAVSLPLE